MAKNKLTPRARKKELTGINLDPIHRRLEELERFSKEHGKMISKIFCELLEVWKLVKPKPKKGEK